MFKVLNWAVIGRAKVLVELLNTYWPERFLINLTYLTPEDAFALLTKTPYVLVMIDLSTVTLLEACKIQKSVVATGWGRVIYLHYPISIDASHILHSKATVGVFNCDCSLTEISDGLAAILKGETIPPENIINELTLQGERPADGVHLTRRELEVLMCTMTGETNAQIATKLFVTEQTIKTHLFRIYKKIGVSTRGKAMSWVREHLIVT